MMAKAMSKMRKNLRVVENSLSFRARPKMLRATRARRMLPQNWMPVRSGRVPMNAECFARVEMPMRTRDSTWATCGLVGVAPIPSIASVTAHNVRPGYHNVCSGIQALGYYSVLPKDMRLDLDFSGQNLSEHF